MTEAQPINSDEIVPVLPLDFIKAIEKPEVIPTVEAEAAMRPEEMVVTLTVEYESRAYPSSVLNAHQIVNDIVGGLPVVITWCPLCFTGLVYARRIHNHEYTFGVSGKLARNALVMYDHQTKTLWSQINGEAIDGPLEGSRLDPVPSGQVNWATWKSRHPNSLVLSKPRGPHGDRWVDPYTAHYRSPTTGLFGPGSIDPRLEAKQFILGLSLSGKAKAYPYRLLQRQPVLNDVVAGTPVLIVFSQSSGSALAYERHVATSQELSFTTAPDAPPGEQVLLDAESGSRWDGLTGQAISGPWRGQTLTRLPSTSAIWSAWHDHYPDTEVYGAEPGQ